MSLDLRHYYSNLREIRELFHSLGKIEDSNAKLDEILKYLSIFIHADSLGKKYYLDFKNKLNSLESNPKEFCNFISKEFLKVKSAKNFKNENGTNIYAEEVLLTNEDDFRIVKKLIFFLLETFEQKKKGSSFDVVNEIFW